MSWLLLVLDLACSRRPRRAEPEPQPQPPAARAPSEMVATPRPRLAAGSLGTCLLGQSGEVRCWGPRGANPRTPRLELADAVQVAVGITTACAIRRDRTVVCWDHVLEEGKLWSGGVHDAASLAMGYSKGCAVTRAGEVRCWDATLQWPPRDRLATKVDGISDATAVAVGMIHACALRRGGTVVCWGGNEAGNLGDGTRVSREQPAPVVDLDDAVEIAAGTYYSCARRRDGSVWCWGGIGQQDPVTRPMRVPEWTGAAELSLNAGCNAGTIMCARMPDGSVRCLGDNGFGQVGDGSKQSRAAPVAVHGLGDASDLAVGCVHVCALRTGGQVVCWGEGETLGFPRGDDQLVPAPSRDL